MESIELTDSEIDKIYECLTSKLDTNKEYNKAIFDKIELLSLKKVLNKLDFNKGDFQVSDEIPPNNMKNKEIIKWIEENIEPNLLYRLQAQLVENKDIMNTIQDVFFEKMLN
jgi:hypothetical protein